MATLLDGRRLAATIETRLAAVIAAGDFRRLGCGGFDPVLIAPPA